MPSFERLVAEGWAAPVDGWDFSWFEGRATEERPPWRYASLLDVRIGRARTSALDIETGGGEVLAGISRRPSRLVATEGWSPNVRHARDRLLASGGSLVAVADTPTLPFVDSSFDLVVSRHPVVVLWAEIARVLRPGGTYLSQQIGAGTNRELRTTSWVHSPSTRAGALPPPCRGTRRRARDRRSPVVRPQGGVLRCRSGGALPAQGPLDRAQVHAHRLRGAVAEAARPDRARGIVRLHGTPAARRGAAAVTRQRIRLHHATGCSLPRARSVTWPPRRPASRSSASGAECAATSPPPSRLSWPGSPSSC